MHISYKISLGILVIAAAVVGVVYSKKHAAIKDTKPGSVAGVVTKPVSNEDQSPIDQPYTPPPTAEKQPSGQMLYKNQQFGFSFEFPSEFKLGGFNQDNGYMLLLQNAQSKGVQIYITDFDEEVNITPERIKKDVPDISLKDPKIVQVNGQLGTWFLGQSDSLGQTREVWFVHKKKLYQILTTPDFDSVLQSLLLSWKW